MIVMSKQKDGFWSTPLTSSAIKTSEVKLPEMVIGYFLGPFGALLSSGIFTSMLQKYLNEVLGLDNSFLTVLPLVSTIFIVIANLVVGQLFRRHDRQDQDENGQGPALDPTVRPHPVGGQRADVHRPL